MKNKRMWGAGLVLAWGMTPAAWGQVGGIGAAGVAGAPAAAAAPGAAAAAPRNIWSFLCMTPEQKQACKEKFCNSQFGQFVNNGMKGPSAFTGGIIPGCCPPVKASDLLKAPDSAEGAASRIKQDEAEAKARRAAVRYLGTVNCNYWPEARDALINSLRADKNECVRWEAAASLARGCCCSKATMKALILTVTCSDADDNPVEPSERVRVMAEHALRNCLDCYVEIERLKPAKPAEKLPVPTEEDEKKDKIKGKDKESGGDADVPAGGTAKGNDTLPSTSAYYQRVSKLSSQEIIASAKHALANAPRVTSVPPPGAKPESHSLTSLWTKSFSGGDAPPPLVDGKLVPAVVVAPPAKPRGLFTRSVDAVASRTTTTTTAPVMTMAPTTTVIESRPVPMPPAAVAYQPVPPAPLPLPPVEVTPPPAVEVKPVKNTTPPVEAKPVETPAPVVPATPPAPPPVPGTIPLPPLEASAVPLPPITVPEPTPAPVPPPPPVVETPAKKVEVPEAKKPDPEPAIPLAVAKPVELPPVPTTLPTPAPSSLAMTLPATKASEPVPTSQPVRPTVETTTPVVSRPEAAPPKAEPAPRVRVVEVTPPKGAVQTKGQLLGVLRESVQPDRREWAVAQLGLLKDGGKDAEVVQALLVSAGYDPAALVRVAALESIRKQQILDYQLAGILQRLKGDSDARVKETAASVDRWLQEEVTRYVNQNGTKVQ